MLTIELCLQNKAHHYSPTNLIYFGGKHLMIFFSLFRYLFSSSVLNLSELVALRPDLSLLHKIIYFHENQLIYPIQKSFEGDFQYGYNQILTRYYCMELDVFPSKTIFINSRREEFVFSVAISASYQCMYHIVQ